MASNQKTRTQQYYTLSVVAIIGLVGGVLASFGTIWNYIYKDDFTLSPANASFFASTVMIPWMIKPIWGLLSDNVPIFGYRRKSYLMIMSALAFFPLFAFGEWPISKWAGFTLLLVINTSTAFLSVIGQALVAENSQEINKRVGISEDEKTKVASRSVTIFFGAKCVGTIIFSLISVFYLHEDERHVFLFYTSFIVLLVFISSFFLPENPLKKKPENTQSNAQPADDLNSEASLQADLLVPENSQIATRQSPWQNLITTWNFIKTPVIYESMLLIFLSNFAPGFTQPKFDYYTTYLGFEASFMSSLTLISYIACGIGLIIYNRFFRNINIKTYYSCTMIIYFFLKLSLLLLVLGISTKIGIPDKIFAACDQFATELGSELNALPIVILMCRICPENIEATIFSLLLALSNVAGILSADMGGAIVSGLGITLKNFDNLWVTVVIAAVFQLVPFLILWKIDYEGAVKKAHKPQEASREVDILNEMRVNEQEIPL